MLAKGLISSEYVLGEKEIYNTLILFKDVLPSLGNGETQTHKIANKLSMNANVLVFKTDNQIVGFVAFYANDKEHHVAYIPYLAVLPNFQRKGYGYVLLKTVEDDSRKLGMTVLKLEVKKKNLSAQGLYKKFGMETDGDASADSIFMRKNL